MIQLPVDADDAQILMAIRGWCELLVQENYYAATEALLPDYWTPELLRAVVENYGSPHPRPDGVKFKMTPLIRALGAMVDTDGSVRHPRHDVHRFKDEAEEQAWGPSFAQTQQEIAPVDAIGYVWFDLPLNGSWSDLTALFDLQIVDRCLVLRLAQLRVM